MTEMVDSEDPYKGMTKEQKEQFDKMLVTMLKMRPSEAIDGGKDFKYIPGRKFHIRVAAGTNQQAALLEWNSRYLRPNRPSSPREWQAMYARIPMEMRTPALHQFLEGVNARVVTMDEKMADHGIVTVE